MARFVFVSGWCGDVGGSGVGVGDNISYWLIPPSPFTPYSLYLSTITSGTTTLPRVYEHVKIKYYFKSPNLYNLGHKVMKHCKNIVQNPQFRTTRKLFFSSRGVINCDYILLRFTRNSQNVSLIFSKIVDL